MSPGSGARGLHAGRPLGGRRTLSRVRAAGAVAAETTRLAGWLAVTVETGERHPSAHEHSVNSVSAESRSAESRRSWHITRKWCALELRSPPAPPSGRWLAVSCSRGAVSGLLFSWVRSMRRRPADWGGRDDEAGWRRLGLGWVS